MGDNRSGANPFFRSPTPRPTSLAGQPSTPLPPLPAPSALTSNAALAAGPHRPIDGSHGTSPSVPSPIPASGPGGTAASPVSNPRPSEPVPNPVARRDPALARGVSSAPLTYEQAQAQLSARGVKRQRLETWGDNGEWKFSCSIPKPGNAYISRVYEAQAPTALAAIQQALEQIDRER